ncbi:MAG: radical SAM family heme chaperone HemW [Thermodesulfobacteriota bacterium]
MLLYIHFPFCQSKCRYCAFVSGPGSQEAIHDWLRLVCAEARIWGRRRNAPRLETVYIGGGTPSLLSAEQVEQLASCLATAFSWPEGIEWTLEANPESFQHTHYAAALQRLGVNRLSFGVQSLIDRELALLGRAHDKKKAARAVRTAREGGMTNISLDLLWGLPGQTVPQWQHTLQGALDLGPDHLSCYALTPEPGTAVYADLQTATLPPLPDEDRLSAMYEHNVARLHRAGFQHYEIANFAPSGQESRHNSGYWQGRPYLGLGPAAVSTLNGRRWTNPPDLQDYASAVQTATIGQPAHQLTFQERFLETLMLRLRTSAGLDRPAFTQEFGIDPLRACPAFCAQLQAQGLAEIAGDTLRLTSTGMLLANSITERLYSALLPQP